MNLKINIGTGLVLILTSWLAGCASEQEKSRYDKLLEYEGKFEYFNGSSLILSASELDTTLYAIVDEARYPLRYVSADTFSDVGKDPVIFQRDEEGRIKSYEVRDGTFKLISKHIDKTVWMPRKELYHHPQKYSYQVPVAMDDGVEVGDLGAAFENPEPIVDMVRETIKGKYPDVHSILIFKGGKLVLEEYFYEYSRDTPHQLRSATKSFIGTLLGIAIDKRLIKSEHERLLPFFKNEYPEIANKDPRKDRITLQDFLTYRHGMDCENDNPESAGNEMAMMENSDWVKHTLDLPMKGEPGVTSSYCTGCPLTVGRMIELQANTPLEEFAEKYLFDPMGISNYKWRFKPDTSSIVTINQMYLTPRDMLKLAVMHMNRGEWQGKQIVSRDWVNKMFYKHDAEFGYLWRHQFFEVDGKRYESYLATGNGGQKIHIWPEFDMITVFTGGNYNSFMLYGRSTPPNEMIPAYILKAL